MPPCTSKDELLAYIDRIPGCCQQLHVTLKTPTFGKSATFNKVRGSALALLEVHACFQSPSQICDDKIYLGLVILLLKEAVGCRFHIEPNTYFVCTTEIIGTFDMFRTSVQFINYKIVFIHPSGKPVSEN